MRILMDEVKILEANLVLQRKTSAEKDQQILVLKSSLESKYRYYIIMTIICFIVYTNIEREESQDQSLPGTCTLINI